MTDGRAAGTLLQAYITECYETEDEGQAPVCWGPYPIAYQMEAKQAPLPIEIRRKVAGEQASFVRYVLTWEAA